MENNNQKKGGFSYTYSAREQSELKKIREKYTPSTEVEDKMARLRRLDASVTNTAQAVALAFGVIGTLILGFGMSLVMTDIGQTLGIQNTMVTGIVIGVIGLLMAIINYPVFKRILASRRKKYAKEIIALSDKIMSE